MRNTDGIAPDYSLDTADRSALAWLGAIVLGFLAVTAALSTPVAEIDLAAGRPVVADF